MFTLLQNFSGAQYEAQSAITKKWLQEYCGIHGYSFTIRNIELKGLPLHFGKLQAIKELPKGSRFLYLDTDAVIKKSAKKLAMSEILPDGFEIGVCMQVRGVSEYNTGVIFGEVTDKVILLCDRALQLGKLPTQQEMAGEQPRINVLIKELGVKVTNLPSEYNQCPMTSLVYRPSWIRAFHSVADKDKIPAFLKLAMELDDY